MTGGAGFLGKHFVQHHVEAGDEVTAIDNMSSAGASWWEPVGTSDIEDLPYEYIERDVRDVLVSDAIANDPWDLAYHFAAPVGGREKIEGDPLYNAGSLGIDAWFFRWAIASAKTVVYPSSSAVYPVTLQGANPSRLHEDDFSARASAWASPDEMYGFTKLVGERLALAASKYGVNTLCIRPFSGYGEGQSLDYPIPSIAKRALARENPLVVWGPGSQQRDFVHVSDLVGATVARVEAGIDGYQTMNIGRGFGLSFNDIARLCADIVGYEPEITNLADKPTGVLNRVANIDRMAEFYQPKVQIREGLLRVVESLT